MNSHYTFHNFFKTCTLDATFCKCNNGYQQIDSKTDRCVLKKDCPGSSEKWFQIQWSIKTLSINLFSETLWARWSMENMRIVRQILQWPEPDLYLGSYFRDPTKYSSYNVVFFISQECRLGCYCVYGNVRNDQGVCIPESECPAVGTQVWDHLGFHSYSYILI